MPFTSDETSLSLVWEENLGSGTLTDKTAVKPSRASSPVVLTLFFLVDLLFHVLIESTCQRRPETGQVGTAIQLRNVIGKTENIFLVGIIPLHGDFDTDTIFLAGKIETPSDATAFCFYSDARQRRGYRPDIQIYPACRCVHRSVLSARRN